MRQNDLLDLLPKIIEIYDDPQADTTAIPIYFISKLASEENIKVVLNGDGPDELFAGYNRYLQTINYYKFFKIAKIFPKIFPKCLFNILKIINSDGRPIDYVDRLNKDREFFWPNLKGVKDFEKNTIFSKSFLDSIDGHSSYWLVEKIKKDYLKFNIDSKDTEDIIDWISYSGFITSDIDRFLFRSDRLGMSNSIELRSPFLSNEMVELGLSIPSELKIKNNIPKYIFKKSLESTLPNEILYRNKMGFCLPLKEWAADTICEYVLDNIDSFNKNFDLFKKSHITEQIRSFKVGKSDNVNKIWSYYFFMNWYNKWVA